MRDDYLLPGTSLMVPQCMYSSFLHISHLFNQLPHILYISEVCCAHDCTIHIITLQIRSSMSKNQSTMSFQQIVPTPEVPGRKYTLHTLHKYSMCETGCGNKPCQYQRQRSTASLDQIKLNKHFMLVKFAHQNRNLKKKK